jgi:hypothetical protein
MCVLSLARLLTGIYGQVGWRSRAPYRNAGPALKHVGTVGAAPEAQSPTARHERITRGQSDARDVNRPVNLGTKGMRLRLGLRERVRISLTGTKSSKSGSETRVQI